MNKVAIAFLTKDRVELSKRSIVPLLQPDKFDLFIVDGSQTKAGQDFIANRSLHVKLHSNVLGGSDPAVVYALTEMLNASTNARHDYTHVGLVENDVLLTKDWFGPVMALFARARAEGLEAGAVSARAYVDRVLCQRDGYALCHNLGWGMQILTREAAFLTLKHMRTHLTTENRRVFARLSGIDIGTYWAFKTNEHWITPDWGNDAVLASHGLASLALVPSPVEMIGQKPSLAEQGLKLATEPVEDRRSFDPFDKCSGRSGDSAFEQFASCTAGIRSGDWDIGLPPVRYRDDTGVEYIFAHQLDSLHYANWSGDWRLKWSPGLGGFAARGFSSPALNDQQIGVGAQFSCYISGTCRFMVGGGEKGGQVAIEDLKSGYTVRPTLLPEASNQVTQVICPATVSWREVRLTVISGNCVFYGIQCQEPQPVVTGRSFDHSRLWLV